MALKAAKAGEGKSATISSAVIATSAAHQAAAKDREESSSPAPAPSSKLTIETGKRDREDSSPSGCLKKRKVIRSSFERAARQLPLSCYFCCDDISQLHILNDLINNSILEDFERELGDVQEVGDRGKSAMPSNPDPKAQTPEPVMPPPAMPEVMIDDTSGTEAAQVYSPTRDVQSQAAQAAAGATTDIGLLLTRPVPAWDFADEIHRRHHRESSSSRGTCENIICGEKVVDPVSGATSFQPVGACVEV